MSEAVTSYAEVTKATAYASTHEVPVAPTRVPGTANEGGSVDRFDALGMLQYDVGGDAVLR